MESKDSIMHGYLKQYYDSIINYHDRLYYSLFIHFLSRLTCDLCVSWNMLIMRWPISV